MWCAQDIPFTVFSFEAHFTRTPINSQQEHVKGSRSTLTTVQRKMTEYAVQKSMFCRCPVLTKTKESVSPSESGKTVGKTAWDSLCIDFKTDKNS